MTSFRRGKNSGSMGPRPNISKRGRRKSAGSTSHGDSGGSLGRRLQAFLHVVVAIGALSLGAWSTFFVVHTYGPHMKQWFVIRQVTVTGAHHLRYGEVLHLLALQPEDTLLSVDPEDLEKRISAHTWVKHAQVERRLFHQLAIHLEERKPIAILRGASANFLIDSDGEILSETTVTEEQSFPHLRGVKPSQLLKGEGQARQAILAGLEVAKKVRGVFQGQPEVYAGNLLNIVARIDGVQIHFGASPFEEKWRLFQQVQPALPLADSLVARPVSGEIDLRYPSKVIVRERGT